MEELDAMDDEEVNTMGMTDLQFKSHLRQLISALERAEEAETPEKVLAEIAKLKQSRKAKRS